MAVQVTVTFRHMDPTEALRDFTRDKFTRSEKFTRMQPTVEVVLSIEGTLSVVSFRAFCVNGHMNQFQGKTQDVDMYTAIGSAADMLEEKIRKTVERSGTRGRRYSYLDRAYAVN